MTPTVEAPVRPANVQAVAAPQSAAPVAPLPPVIEMKHGQVPREMTRASLRALDGHGDPGKFGRMFPTLDPLVVSDDALFALADAMKDTDFANPAGDNPTIPAGFTYLGQFVDHDITLDLTPLDQQAGDPMGVVNFRSPALDLDALYGAGSAQQPYLFDRSQQGRTTARMLIGVAGPSADPRDPAGVQIPALPNDLPRNRVGRALIGDERNDENLLVSQTHLAFLKFHNRVVEMLEAERPGLTGADLFAEARRITSWHYQWIVLFDFVERLTEPGLVRRIRHEGRRFYRFKTTPYIPVEFSAAGYRTGHSMVREAYDHNRVFNSSGVETFADGTLGLLFHFTGKSGAVIGDLAATVGPGDFPPPGAFPQLPSNWVIDWRRFYDFQARGVKVNASRRIDPFVVPTLHSLPGEQGRSAVLPFRNLKRGVNLDLPAGQDVARAMGFEPLSEADIATGPDGLAAKDNGMGTRTPLWYYILKEAQVHHQGKRLGPVGSTIVAETFLGLVHGDHKSFMWLKSNWKPELPRADAETFTMVDMLNFVGDLNPVG